MTTPMATAFIIPLAASRSSPSSCIPVSVVIKSVAGFPPTVSVALSAGTLTQAPPETDHDQKSIIKMFSAPLQRVLAGFVHQCSGSFGLTGCLVGISPNNQRPL